MRRPAPRYLTLRLSWDAGAWTNMSRDGNRLTKDPSLSEVLVKRMLTVKELATYIGLPVQRIYVLNHMREIPFHRIGRSVLYDRIEIDAWLDAKKVEVLLKDESDGGRSK